MYVCLYVSICTDRCNSPVHMQVPVRATELSLSLSNMILYSTCRQRQWGLTAPDVCLGVADLNTLIEKFLRDEIHSDEVLVPFVI